MDNYIKRKGKKKNKDQFHKNKLLKGEFEFFYYKKHKKNQNQPVLTFKTRGSINIYISRNEKKNIQNKINFSKKKNQVLNLTIQIKR